ncbi:MAG: hypothetical protein K2Q23_16705, partial [Bryobacteraceae bacterium]|nr:hypothetical protein [Bryobacteraceae bacterium]
MAAVGRKPVHLCIPEGFNPALHLPGVPPRLYDRAFYLLHRIAAGMSRNSRARGKMVPLFAEEMRSFFRGNKDYMLVKRALIGTGAIVCDDQFEKGKRPMMFALGPQLRRGKMRRVVVSDERLAGRIRRDIEGRRKAAAKSDLAVFRHLRANLERVTIELEEALEWLSGIDGVESDYAAAIGISNEDFRGTDPDRYGRLHTNITNLRYGLRAYLRIDGKPLVCLDVKNSQPLILAGMLLDDYRDRPMPDDVKRFVRLTQEGQFYDELMGRLGWSPDDRKLFKKAFFRYLFGRNRPAGMPWRNSRVTRLVRAIERAFPNVAAFIARSKEGDGPKAHAKLAHRLLRRESDIILHGAVRSLMGSRPDAPVLTIHDAILTTADYAGDVEEAIRTAFLRYGLRATIDRSDCLATYRRRKRRRRAATRGPRPGVSGSCLIEANSSKRRIRGMRQVT